MINKLEVYAVAIVAGVLLLVLGTTLGYFKGRLDEHESLSDKQQAANVKAIGEYADTAKQRADADADATDKTRELIATVDQGITNAQKRFAGLPAVVVDARGCARLSDTARVRWNAVELLPTGSADPSAGDSSGPVSTVPLPVAR